MALKKNFLKPALTIKNIGIVSFVRGIIVGLFLSILLYLLFIVCRDALKLIVPIENMPVQDNTSHYLTNLFFAALAIVFSFNITMIIWLSKSKYMKLKYRVRKNLFKTNSFFGTYSTLSWFSRITLLYAVMLPTYFLGFENLFAEYAFALILVLLYLFFQQWNYVALIYKTGKWMLISFIMLATLSFIYSSFSVIDNSKLNRTHELRTKYRYDFIDKELKRAANWGINFSEIETNGLKYNDSYVTKKYKKQIFEALGDTLDTINLKLLIVHKIFIHNFYYNFEFVRFYLKRHPLSKVDYYEDMLSRLDSTKQVNETKLIFEILSELNQFVNHKTIFTQDEFNRMSYGEILRYEHIFNLTYNWPEKWGPFAAKQKYDQKDIYFSAQEIIVVEEIDDGFEGLRNELNDLIYKLVNDPKYSAYHDILENKNTMSESNSDQ